MLTILITRKFYKTYLLLPLLVYACVMYWMLDNDCGTKTVRKDCFESKGELVPASRKIMEFRGNKSEQLINIVSKYTALEEQKRKTADKILHLINKEELSYLENAKPFLNFINSFNSYNYHLSETEKSFTHPGAVQSVKKTKYLINCSNIQEVRLQSKIGHGVSKQTFKADFKGQPVAVKMVTRHQSEVKSCLEKINKHHPKKNELRSRCFVFPTMKLMKEILLLEQLSHPGFVQLLGYCVRNEDSETTDLNERGIASVFELGERIILLDLQTLTWQERLRHAMELADFLHYLEHSPLGSLRIRDFKEDHFLLVNNSLKLIDLDDVDNLEPSCNVYVSADTQEDLLRSGKSTGCEFDLTCQRGLCIGFNAKQNMRLMNLMFFKKLLFPTLFPREISSEVGYLLADIDSNLLSASTLIERLSLIKQVLNK